MAAPAPGAAQSLAEFHDKLGKTRLVEGSADFEIHRVVLLNAVERWILFGVSGYRRALDMLIPGNAPWAQVTLYYSSFFAANAILGMFGAWVHIRRLVDVENGNANSQVLKVAKKVKSPNGYPGSHQRFWDFFYEGYSTFSPWIPAGLQSTTAPVNSNRVWQIDARNEVNYDMFRAHEAALGFKQHFKPNRLRSLRGSLAQQMEVTEAMLKLAIYFANDLGVSSCPYEGLEAGVRPVALRRLVTKVPPSLTGQSVLQDLLR
jgi:nitroreductase